MYCAKPISLDFPREPTLNPIGGRRRVQKVFTLRSQRVKEVKFGVVLTPQGIRVREELLLRRKEEAERKEAALIQAEIQRREDYRAAAAERIKVETLRVTLGVDNQPDVGKESSRLEVRSMGSVVTRTEYVIPAVSSIQTPVEFRCRQCFKLFANQEFLTIHMERKHPVILDPLARRNDETEFEWVSRQPKKEGKRGRGRGF